jgi:hypothetical protein
MYFFGRCESLRFQCVTANGREARVIRCEIRAEISSADQGLMPNEFPEIVGTLLDGNGAADLKGENRQQVILSTAVRYSDCPLAKPLSFAPHTPVVLDAIRNGGICHGRRRQ